MSARDTLELATLLSLLEQVRQERDDARQMARQLRAVCREAGLVCETCGRILEWRNMDGFQCPHCEPPLCAACGQELVDGTCPLSGCHAPNCTTDTRETK